jgi:hypothetical protein
VPSDTEEGQEDEENRKLVKGGKSKYGCENFGVKLALDSIILTCKGCDAEARLRPEVALAYWWSCWQKSKSLKSN